MGETPDQRIDRLEKEVEYLKEHMRRTDAVGPWVRPAWNPWFHQQILCNEQTVQPCMFDNLTTGVYGLVCSCPRHSQR